MEHVVIRLHDSFSTSLRSIVLLSARGKAVTRKGAIIPRSAAISGHSTAMDFLRHNWAHRRMGNAWEPDWFITGNTIRAAALLGVTNLTEITNGLGAGILHEHIRTTRNVIAHSVPNTWQRFRNLQLSEGLPTKTLSSPADFAASIDVPTGKRRIDLWFDEVEVMIWAAIE
jgi:hypothetical protein